MPLWKFFTVSGSIRADLEFLYAIRSRLVTDMEFEYDMIALESNMTFEYNILQKVDFSELVFPFEIHQAVISDDMEYLYSVRQLVVADAELVYDIRRIFWNDCTFGPYALPRLSRDMSFPYSLIGPVISDMEFIYNMIHSSVFAEMTFGYRMPIVSDMEFNYWMIAEPKADIEFPFNLVYTLSNDFSFRYDLSQYNFPLADCKFVYALFDPTSEVVVTDVEAEIDGNALNVKEISLSSDDESYAIRLSAELGDVESWQTCEPESIIVFLINGETFRFIIDSRNRTRSFGSATYSIDGKSPACLLAEGRASAITDTWEATTAVTVIEELCAAAGISVQIEITDWPIPDGRLTAEGEYPIEIINKIAEATGAILQSKPDGTLVVRYKHTTSPTKYNEITPETNFSDLEDIFEVTETREVNAGYNAVRISDEDYSDSQTWDIREVERDDRAGTVTLAVEVYPWSDSVNLQTSDDPANVSVLYEGVQEETITETIEIVQGSGSTSSTVYEIVSWSYTYNDLGTPYADGNNIYTNSSGQAMMTITYKTKWHQFIATNTELGEVQFYTED